MAQVGRLSPGVGSRLALFCVHHVNRVKSGNDSSTINVVLGVIITTIIIITLLRYC